MTYWYDSHESDPDNASPRFDKHPACHPTLFVIPFFLSSRRRRDLTAQLGNTVDNFLQYSRPSQGTIPKPPVIRHLYD